MKYNEFADSLTHHAASDALSPLLRALWHAGRDEWRTAHDIAQAHEGTPHFDWLHALLHRQKGDASNAAYWYRRAGRPAFSGSIRAEWEALARTQWPGQA
ncbi:hypothetical protein [Hymenobacter psychrotolerans]|uniref:Uncharacterized protein n=1 Tax=Hymenobacter psychrotolerans DSM 18569 TaxID=1121959 RepID=A0A1M6RY16_9BACT|nr:hypothetical protein [Hymenobacter psychrotolerans]SHK37415.1 hypothetical protein SAMN02746009_00827 [Hymenobacter psychrotolerans DSM 18569]